MMGIVPRVCRIGGNGSVKREEFSGTGAPHEVLERSTQAR
jgi:hypothetical protein